MFKCSELCTKSWDKESSLTTHQNSCQIYLTEQIAIRARLRTKLHAACRAKQELRRKKNSSEQRSTLRPGMAPTDIEQPETPTSGHREFNLHPGIGVSQPEDTSAESDVRVMYSPSQAQDIIMGNSTSSETTTVDTTCAASPELPDPEADADPMDESDTVHGRENRVRVMTQPLVDHLPEGPAPLPEHPAMPSEIEIEDPRATSGAPLGRITRLRLRVRETIRTALNTFGVYREYQGVPEKVPDENVDITDLTVGDDSNISRVPPQGENDASISDLGPFPNISTLNFLNWFWNCGSLKSRGDRDRLVKEVFHSPDGFHAQDIQVAQLHKLDSQLSGQVSRNPDPFPHADGWIDSPIEIPVPDGVPHPAGEEEAPKFAVPHFYHRKLTEVIKAAFVAPAAERFHFTAYKQFWQSPTDPSAPPLRVVDEMYNSDAFLAAHEEIQRLPPEPNCNLPRAVAGFMFASDGLQLTSFGDASLWPGYAYFANQSKWERTKPSARAAHHIAYFPKLPDTINDFLAQFPKISASGKAALLTHLKRELFQACWAALLDDDFRHAWVHGIVIECADGITRRLYPRIFTYSADYPEKVLISSIRNLGQCPCPRCRMPMRRIPDLGTRLDTQRREALLRRDDADKRYKTSLSRKFIYQEGRTVTSDPVERVLKEESLTPTRNAFSDFAAQLPEPRAPVEHDSRFFMYLMLVVDFMHDWELGVWKALLIHLIRLVTAQSVAAVQTLDFRFRHIPPFGRDTIRKFSSNVSGLTRLAAHDFEDILLCSIPAFEGLLPPPHNEIILSLLFIACWFHSLAKLKMHTEVTLLALSMVTTFFGQHMRRFKSKTCDQINTFELDREVAAQARRLACENPSSPTPTGGKQPKIFNLFTYKFHALGDYVTSIRWFGTTDSYSTQASELEHRTSKASYLRTNKNNTAKELAAIERRQCSLHAAVQHRQPGGGGSGRQRLGLLRSEPITNFSPDAHHHVPISQKNPVYVGSWLSQNSDDPALKTFLPNLKDHLLARLLGLAYDGDEYDFTDADRATVILKDNKLYSHKVLRINYTTYDLRRDQDTINPSTPRRFIMLKAHDDQQQKDSHPFWYAQVLGIFHTWVVHSGPRSKSRAPQRFDFLWIRWLGPEPGYRAGWKALRLDRIGFIGDEQDSPSFGILDPANVIRAAHLIPAFQYGLTSRFLGPSFIRDTSGTEDWESFYVNRFADRDIFMRYFGGGVGHLGQETSRIHWHAAGAANAATQNQPPDNETEDQDPLVDTEGMHDSDEELDDVDDLDGIDPETEESDGDY